MMTKTNKRDYRPRNPVAKVLRESNYKQRIVQTYLTKLESYPQINIDEAIKLLKEEQDND